MALSFSICQDVDFTNSQAVVSNTCTFTSQAIGTAASDRVVYVFLVNDAGTIDSVTIGGVSATSSAFSGLWYAPVSTGTTANVVVNTTDATEVFCYVIYRSVGSANVAISDENSGFNLGTPSSAGAINIPAGGGIILLGVVGVSSGTPTLSFTAPSGVTAGTQDDNGTGLYFLAATKNYASADTGVVCTVDQSGGTASLGQIYAYAIEDLGGSGSPYTLAANQGTFTTTGQAANLLLGPYWTYVGKSEAAVNASGNYTLTEPSGTQQDDILVVDFAVRSTVLYTNADFTFPQSDAGGNTTNNTTGSDVSYQTGYCIRGASAPTLTFSRTGGSRALGTMRAYRSSRAGTPSFDTSAEVAMGAAGTTVTLSGGVTTAEIDELLVTAVYGARANTVSNMDGTTEVTGNSGSTDTTTPPVFGTWTERSDRNNGTSPTVALACYDTIKRTAGSTGNLTATESQSALHGMTVMAFKHPALSGSPYTMPAALGTFAANGVAAGLKRGYPLAASQGSFAINGVSAGLRPGYKVGASVGTYAITGVSAGSVRTYNSPSDVGTFVINGQNAILRYSPDVIGGTGTFTISGQNAGLKVGYNVVAGQGSVVITGQDATLTYTPVGQNFTLTADVGSFSITGQSASLQKGSKVGAQTGSYSITGQAATLRADARLLSDLGVFQINGQNAILRKNTVAGYETGTFNITGVSANFLLGRKLLTDTGAFVITGQNANFTLPAKKLTPEVGAFVIQGYSADLRTGSFVPSGAYWKPETTFKDFKPKETLPLNKIKYVNVDQTVSKSAAILARAGGHARAESLTAKQRSQIASNAAKARWK